MVILLSSTNCDQTKITMNFSTRKSECGPQSYVNVRANLTKWIPKSHIEWLTNKCKGVGARVETYVLEHKSSHQATIYEQLYNCRTKGVEAGIPSTELTSHSQDKFVILEEILIPKVPRLHQGNFLKCYIAFERIAHSRKPLDQEMFLECHV